jgi:hypothetical protein
VEQQPRAAAAAAAGAAGAGAAGAAAAGAGAAALARAHRPAVEQGPFVVCDSKLLKLKEVRSAKNKKRNFFQAVSIE